MDSQKRVWQLAAFVAFMLAVIPFATAISIESIALNATQQTVGESIGMSVSLSMSSPARVYVCNSTRVAATGCMDQEYGRSGFLPQSPIGAVFTVPDIPYVFVYACDNSTLEWVCTAPIQAILTLNHKPTVQSIAVQDNGTLVCQVTASDAEADQLSISYAWQYASNGTWITLGNETGNILPRAHLRASDAWRCEATVSDGKSKTTQRSSEYHVDLPTPLGDTTPSITALADNSGAACSTGLSPLITIDWVNERPVRAYICSSANILVSGCFETEYARSDFSTTQINVTLPALQESTPSLFPYFVRVCDDQNRCSAVKNRTIAVNHAPTATNVSLADTFGSGALTCAFVYDPKDAGINDTEFNSTISWYRNDAGILTRIGEGIILNLSTVNLSKRSPVLCSVIARDVFGNADAFERYSNQIELANNPPSIQLMFEPTAPTAGQALRCVVNASDADGDVVDLTYQWLRDNQTYNATASQVLSNLTQANETWTCIVSASDGWSETQALASVVITAIPVTPPSSGGGSSSGTSGSSGSSGGSGSGGGSARSSPSSRAGGILPPPPAPTSLSPTVDDGGTAKVTLTIDEGNDGQSTADSRSDAQTWYASAPAPSLHPGSDGITGFATASANTMLVEKSLPKQVNTVLSIILICSALFFMARYAVRQRRNF